MSDDWKSKFADVVSRDYAGQAKFWMNAYWLEGAEQECERIWEFVHTMIELDPSQRERGNELAELEAHRFLEKVEEAHTVIELRKRLKQMDIDNNKKMALVEFFLFHYEKDVQDFLSKPQGDNTAEIEAANQMIVEVQVALADVQTKLADQKLLLEEQKKQEAEAQRTLEEQQHAEALVAKAEAELKAAIDQMDSEQKAFHDECASLEKQADDPRIGVVKKGLAVQKLAQLREKGDENLRKSKITTEALLRKVQKEKMAAEEATARAQEQSDKAAEARAEAEEKTREVEAAVEETERKMDEALAYLEEVKSKGGPSYGDIWWMERELKEAQRYLPQKKQKL